MRYTRDNHPVRPRVDSVIASGTQHRTLVLACGHTRSPLLRDTNRPIRRGDRYPCVRCPLPKEA